MFLLLRLSGFGTLAAGLATAPWAIGLALGLTWNPWLMHRLLTGLPETLILFSGLGLAFVGWRLWFRGQTDIGNDIRWVTALTLTTFLLRAGGLNHPDFYHPDYTIHAGLVGVVRSAGFDLLVKPSHYLWSPREDGSGSPSTSRSASGLWPVGTVGGPQGMPYSLAFHALVAPLGLEYDALLTLLKLVGALVSVAPIPIAWALARRRGISPLGAGLLALLPTAMSELTSGFLPALMGHALDMGLLLWLAFHLERIRVPRVFATGVLLVATCQLAYVYSLLTTVMVLTVLAVLGPLTPQPSPDPSGSEISRPKLDRRWSAAVLGMGLVGTLIAFAVYYRGFWDAIAAIGTDAIHKDPLAPAVPRFRLGYLFGLTFWGGPYLAAGLLGLVLILRRPHTRALFGAWAGAYLILLGLRLFVSNAMRFGHENLFAAPLLALGAEKRSRPWRGAGGSLSSSPRGCCSCSQSAACGCSGASWPSSSAEPAERLAGQGLAAASGSWGARSFQARMALKSVLNSPWFCHL